MENKRTNKDNLYYENVETMERILMYVADGCMRAIEDAISEYGNSIKVMEHVLEVVDAYKQAKKDADYYRGCYDEREAEKAAEKADKEVD